MTLQKILTSCWWLWLVSISPAWSQQSLAWEDPARYRVTRFGTDSLDRGIYLIKDQQDFLVVAFSYHHHAQLMLAGLDKQARIQWQRVYPSTKFQFAFAGTLGSNHSVILSGYGTGAGTDQDAFLARVTMKGDTLWTKKIGGPGNDRVYKTIRTRDGYFLSVGQTQSWGALGIDSFVIKFDETGTVLWQKVFPGDLMERTYSAIELEDGDLIVSGIMREDYPGNSDILILRISPDGALVWKQTHATPKGEIAHSLHKMKDDTYFMVGYTAEKSDSLSDPMILHMNKSGEVLAKHIFVTGEDVKLINGFLTDDNVFVGTGFARKTLNSDWNLLLATFDFKTSTLVTRKLPLSDQDEEGYHVQPLDRNTALIVGHTMAENGDVLLVKWKYR